MDTEKLRADIRAIAEAALRKRMTRSVTLATGQQVTVKYVCYRYADLYVDGRDCGRFLWDYGVTQIVDKAMGVVLG